MHSFRNKLSNNFSKYKIIKIKQFAVIYNKERINYLKSKNFFEVLKIRLVSKIILNRAVKIIIIYLKLKIVIFKSIIQRYES